MVQNQHHATLGVISFGLAVGVTWGLCVFVLGVVAALLGWGIPVAAALASLYIGYGPTIIGAVAGAVWAVVSGTVVGLLVAWLYNRFLLGRRRGLPS